ncbi:MAG: hypothetical protein IJT44_02680 [Clostridia bacterium]|nr:hypothetical protein [Clostridia bacterium]
MNLSANGFLQAALTMQAADTIPSGTTVKLTDNFTASAAENGDAFVGVVLTCSGALCAVQMRGAVTLPYSGTAPSVGPAVLVSDGDGGVKSAESGTSVCVLAVDTVRGTLTCIL